MRQAVMLALILVLAQGCAHEFTATTEEGRRCLYQCDAWYNACQSGCYGPDATANFNCSTRCTQTWNSCGNSCPGVVDATAAASQQRTADARRKAAERQAAAQQKRVAKEREKQARADAAAHTSSASSHSLKDGTGVTRGAAPTPQPTATAAERRAYVAGLAKQDRMGGFEFSLDGEQADSLVIRPNTTSYSRADAEWLASGAREELRSLGFKSLVFVWPSGESVLFNLTR